MDLAVKGLGERLKIELFMRSGQVFEPGHSFTSESYTQLRCREKLESWGYPSHTQVRD